MGRQKSTTTRLNSTDEWNLNKPLDYIPVKKRRSARKNGLSAGVFYKVILPNDRNRELHLGRICVGRTQSALPDEWKTCKMRFVSSQEQRHLLIEFDSSSMLVELVPGLDVLKDIIVTKIFAINVSLDQEEVYFDLFFCELPLPKFNKKIGDCVQTVLALLLDIPMLSEQEDEEEDDEISSEAITQLYKNIKCIREKELKLGSKNVQDIRLKPELRPYQADAVRWMLHREQGSGDGDEHLNPLYTVIKLKSGLEVYYDKYSGYLEKVKPIVQHSSRGGILADEMGLGKTVEVLALILNNPKPDSSSTETTNLQKSPTVDKIAKKRKMEDDKMKPSVDESKKIKVPDDRPKSSSKKTQTRIALEMWYNNCLGEMSTKTASNKNVEKGVQCVCGTNQSEDRVTCIDCGKIQHGACFGYKTSFGPYRCAQCWMHQPMIESKATLIVAPTTLKAQWCDEICKHMRGDFKVVQYGGPTLIPIYPTDLTKYDIVVTTYAVLQSELRLTENEKELSLRFHRRYSTPGSPIARIKWWRLCLDEAQTVETPTSMVSEMAKKLEANFRWAVTGTPITKEISDLQGLINYLQMEPYNDKYTWEQILFNPYRRGQPEAMHKFLSQVLWRSSKDEIIDQINIPKQTVQEHWLRFSAVEHYFYRCEHKFCRYLFLLRSNERKHDTNVTLQTLDKSSLKYILAPLLSLRQVCTFPNSTRVRYLSTKKPVKSMKDLLEALIAKNTTESEEMLRMDLCTLNGLAGIYLLQQFYQKAIELYVAVLLQYLRFTRSDAVAKLSIDKLQIIHTMHNLAEVLDMHPHVTVQSRFPNLRKDCFELEQKYIAKFINQSLSAFQDTLTMSANITKLQGSFMLEPGRWYNDLLNWIYINDYKQEFYTRIENLHENAGVEPTVEFRNERALIFFISTWDGFIYDLRQSAINSINKLYTHCPENEFKIVISQELVRQATDCHLRPQKKGKKKICSLCACNDDLKTYELNLFSMTKRTQNFVDMALKGSWKPKPQELIFKSILAIGRAKNADSSLIKDGEVHINILDAMKKEFKELRRFWTFLDQQICSQDELDMCKIRMRLKEKSEVKVKKTPLLQNLSYNMENKLETIHCLDEDELEYQKSELHDSNYINALTLKKNLGIRNYLETLQKQQYEGQQPDPCPICKNSLEQHWGIIPCGHSYCLECIQLLVETRSHRLQCCICRDYHLVTDISYIKIGQSTETENTNIKGNYSTKVEGIVNLILQLKDNDKNVKVLVFSAWVFILGYIREALDNNDIITEMVSTGNLDKQIARFKDPAQKVTVLLLPIHLGGKGLNLIEATHVILTEPLLTSGEELQAVGRVHRIGQTKPTVVHKFFIKNTIEESIQNAISANAENWERNKVTLQQLMDLFVADAETSELSQPESQPE